MPEKRKLSFTVHGHPAQNERVLAAVFAQKLAALIRGLRSADALANGAQLHEYVIADLGVGSARAALDEVIARHGNVMHSAVAFYGDCVDALSHSDFRKALDFGETVNKVASLTNGVGKKFSHAEIEIDDGRAFRVDGFLAQQAARAIRVRKEELGALRYFSGTSEGTFDGEIQEVDLRGAIPQVKLILTAGSKEIDCTLRGFSVEAIRAALKRRSRFEGRAVYSGESALPVRIEIRRIAPIEPASDFRRWKGSFAPFEVVDWDSDA
jgi:hypothetical protein